MRWPWSRPAPIEPPEPIRDDTGRVVKGISDVAIGEARAAGRKPINPYTLPTPPPGVIAGGMAADALPSVQTAVPLYAWAQQSIYREGLGFLGFSYLAELAQRPEYRMIFDTYAREATRKWIKVRGANDERVAAVNDALNKWKVQERFRELALLDGQFGRGHLYIDTGRPDDDFKPLVLRKETIGKGRLKNLTVVEPMWTYPAQYNATNPLAPDYYNPSIWHVMGKAVHASRLLTVVGREVPDILKPAYTFGGMSLSQMAKPYVDNWLRTRQSVSDLLHAFSTMVLKTNIGTIIQGAVGAMKNVLNRVQMFNVFRDNHGTMVIDKETEEMENIAVPLGTLDKLQAQSQEQMASVAGIPLVVLLGVTPSGLNASSDGEVRTFYDKVHSYQEHTFREPLRTVIDVIQLSEFGDIDPTITFDFEPLWQMDEKDEAAIRKSDADADAAYVNMGAVSNEEVRERLSNDETGLYRGVNLSGPPPVDEPDDDPDADANADADPS
jgi:uncharacterized protein